MTTEIAAINSNDIEVVNSVEGYINTFSMDTIEGRMATINAYNSAVSLSKHVGSVLEICDCITMPGIRKGRNGQLDTSCQNTYLIDTAGIAYFSQSDGVKNSINVIAAMFPDFGKSFPQGCLQLVCKEQELDNGNTIKSIDVVPW